MKHMICGTYWKNSYRISVRNNNRNEFTWMFFNPIIANVCDFSQCHRILPINIFICKARTYPCTLIMIYHFKQLKIFPPKAFQIIFTYRF